MYLWGCHGNIIWLTYDVFQVSAECDTLRSNLEDVTQRYVESQVEIGALQGQLSALRAQLEVRTKSLNYPT